MKKPLVALMTVALLGLTGPQASAQAPEAPDAAAPKPPAAKPAAPKPVSPAKPKPAPKPAAPAAAAPAAPAAPAGSGPNDAFGAFQRGYYLTAFSIATKRASEDRTPRR